MKMMKVFALILVAGTTLTLLSSCGSSNSDAPMLNDGGQHPVNWVSAGHSLAFTAHPDQCYECHGSDLLGGISKVSCVSCHVNLQPGQVPVLGQCVSCHGKPPATGQHTFHSTSSFGPQLGTNCDPCHHGVGSGTGDALHGIRAASGLPVAVVFNPALAGASATYTSSAKRCDNVDCHGGGSRTW